MFLFWYCIGLNGCFIVACLLIALIAFCFLYYCGFIWVYLLCVGFVRMYADLVISVLLVGCALVVGFCVIG